MENTKTKIVFILRGVPGSGKSSFAKGLVANGGVIHSTDDFFCKDGDYSFDPDRLGEFHTWNFLRFKTSLRNGIPVVVLDNTNSQKREWIHYAMTARSFGYYVVIISMPHPDPEIAARRNVHRVPEDCIRKMLERWEN